MTRTNTVKNQDEGFLYAIPNPYVGNGLISQVSLSNMQVDYDNLAVASFAVGDTITGVTSSATGIVVDVFEDGTTGYLILDNTSSKFQDGEQIGNGTATADVDGIPAEFAIEITRRAEDVYTPADAEVVVRAVTAVEGSAADTVLTVAQEITYTGKAGGPYTVGETVTESVSGATGVVVADSNSGATGAGVLTFSGIVGTFTGGQTLTGGGSGATSTGVAYTDRQATFTEATQPDEAVRVTIGGIALSPVIATGGAAKNTFEILRGFPTFGSSDYGIYITSTTSEEGERTVPIRDKNGPLQSRKRVADVVRTLSITHNYVNEQAALLAIAGKDAVLIYERDDDQAGIATETRVFLQARNNMLKTANESEGADISDITTDLRFERSYYLTP